MQLPVSGWQKFLQFCCGMTVILAACPVAAGGSVDLRQLAFYPAPLEATGQQPSGPAPAPPGWRQADTVDMHNDGALLLERHQREIAALRDASGVFAAGLIEPLAALARQHQARGEHEAALAALSEAVQISRRYDGLRSDEQQMLNEQMIVSLRALRRYAEVDEKYRFLVELSRRRSDATAAGRAEALVRLGEWKLESFHRNLALPDQGQMQAASLSLGRLGTQTVRNTHFDALAEAQHCFVEAARLLIESEAWTNPTLFAAERNLVRTFYADAHRERVIADPLSYAGRVESSRDRMRRQAAALDLAKPYQQGEAAYRRMIGYLKKDPAATIGAIAEVLQGLADWHLLFGKQVEAEAQYRQLQKFLALAEAPPEQAAAILTPALPATLPSFLASPLAGGTRPDDGQMHGYVDFAFEVQRHGHAANLEVLGSSAGTDAAITDRLVSLVQHARFRPAPNGDAAVAIRYYYQY